MPRGLTEKELDEQFELFLKEVMHHEQLLSSTQAGGSRGQQCQSRGHDSQYASTPPVPVTSGCPPGATGVRLSPRTVPSACFRRVSGAEQP